MKVASDVLATRIGSLTLRNPVMPASGTFEWLGAEDASGVDVCGLGAIVTKSITREPQPGNPPLRIAETPSGMLNAIGIPSIGLRAFVTDVLPVYGRLGIPIVVSVQAASADECRRMVTALGAEPAVSAVELNLSCPNLEGGEIIAQSVELTAAMVAAARGAAPVPLIAKLSPNVTSIADVARAAEAAGADALCLINTVRGMAVEVETRRALLGNRSGGLSGPAIKPIALSMVWECFGAVGIPIVGAGGIATTEDALQFLLAGATAVQVGTATFRDPRAMPRIVAGLDSYCAEEQVGSIADLVGWCHRAAAVVGG